MAIQETQILMHDFCHVCIHVYSPGHRHWMNFPSPNFSPVRICFWNSEIYICSKYPDIYLLYFLVGNILKDTHSWEGLENSPEPKFQMNVHLFN